jgi:hypothetical protein
MSTYNQGAPTTPLVLSAPSVTVTGNLIASATANAVTLNVANGYIANIYTSNIVGFIGSQWTGTVGSTIYYVPQVGIGSTLTPTANLQVTGNVFVSASTNTASLNVSTATVTSTLTTAGIVPAQTGTVGIGTAGAQYTGVYAQNFYGSGASLTSIPMGQASGTLAIANGGTGQTTASAAFNALSPMTTAGDLIYGGVSGAGTRLGAGTATQLLHGGTTPSWGSVSLTADVSGTLPITNGGTGATSTSQNYVFAGPTSGSGAPSFRALASGDVPTLNQNTTGSAGSLSTTYGTGQILYGQASGVPASTSTFVYSSGKVGIGVASPGYALDVVGQIRASQGVFCNTTSYTIANGTATNWYRIGQMQSGRYKLYVSCQAAGMHNSCMITINDQTYNGGYPTITISDFSSYGGNNQQLIAFRYLVGNGQAGPYYLEVLVLGNYYSTFTLPLYVYLVETDPTGGGFTLTSPITTGSIPSGYSVGWSSNCVPFSVSTQTTNTPSLVCAYSGNIGIGITTPVTPLTIYGAVGNRFGIGNGDVYLTQGQDSGTNRSFLQCWAGGSSTGIGTVGYTLCLNPYAGNTCIGGLSDNGNILQVTGNSNFAGSVQIGTSGSSAMNTTQLSYYGNDVVGGNTPIYIYSDLRQLTAGQTSYGRTIRQVTQNNASTSYLFDMAISNVNGVFGLWGGNNFWTGLNITQGGNVGIGTSSAVTSPKLFSANDVYLNGSLYAGDFACQIAAVGASNPNKRLALMYDTSNNISLVQSMIVGTGTSPLILNAAGGNVGIGLTNPGSALEVNGVMRFSGASTLNPGINMPTGGSGITWGNTYSRILDDGDLRFVTDDNMHWCTGSTNSTLGTERLTLIANGNIGINQTSPGYTLDVNGSERVTGNQYLTSSGNQLLKRYISTVNNQNTTGYSYTNFNGGYNTPYSFTYTRVNQNSTIEVIAYLQLSHAVGANGTSSYFPVLGRITITSSASGTTYTTPETRSWIRSDNGFFELTNTKLIYYTFSDTGFTTGSTITINVQVQATFGTGSAGRFGVNLWSETSIVYVNEYV